MLFPSLVLLAGLGVALADKNTTIDDTDPSIQYSGGGGHTLPCLYSEDGTFEPGQPGCFNQGPKNCSDGAHILQGQESTLSMSFKGSAIYLNSLLDDISNVYTITLDGKSTDVDGVRPGGPLLCYTLFSETGLDPAVEHSISVAMKSLSPTQNATRGSDSFFFWLDNFIVTTPDDASSTSASGSASAGASSTASASASTIETSTSSTTSPSPTGSAAQSTISMPLLLLFGFFFALF